MASQVTAKKNAKNGDAAMNRITCAFLMMVASVLLFRLFTKKYATVGGFRTYYPILPFGAIAFGVLLIVCGVLYLKSEGLRREILGWALLPLTLGALSCMVLRLTWVDYTMPLMFLHVMVYLTIMLYYLYQWEFTLFTLVTAVAGMYFYRFASASTLTLCIKTAALVVLLLGVAVVTFLAARHNGCLKIGKTKIRLFTRHLAPAILYFICALWLLCAVVSLILGSGFAYYCLFAAIAAELIAAVYYTFQLK